MLVTSQFVVLNVPKTGSSFVRQVLKDIYAARRRANRAAGRWPTSLLRAAIGRAAPAGPDTWLRELMLPNTRLPGRGRDQHGTFAQIPTAWRDRPIVSVLRDPWSKLASDYTFRWWAKYPPVPLPKLQAILPHFPDLTFDDFLTMSRMTAAAKLGRPNDRALGNLTIEFVQFFFRDPAAALDRLSDDYVASGRFMADMPAVRFLRQERLNEDLADALAAFGFSAGELEQCRRSDRVNVSPPAPESVRWTAEDVAVVGHEERYLLRMLDRLGFTFPAPVTA